MRRGIHPTQQEQIVRFVQGALRKQVWTMVIVAVLTVVVAALYTSPQPQPSVPGIAMIQSSTFTASGFLIGGNVVLTTARVVDDQEQVFVGFQRGAQVPGRVLITDRGQDFAVIEVESADTHVVPYALGDSDAVTVGEEVKLVGFPGPGSYVETRARVTSKGESEFRTSTASIDGNSGGAAIAPDGTVAGIIGSTQQLGSPKDDGRHWVVPINLVKRGCREKGHPID